MYQFTSTYMPHAFQMTFLLTFYVPNKLPPCAHDTCKHKSPWTCLSTVFSKKKAASSVSGAQKKVGDHYFFSPFLNGLFSSLIFSYMVAYS